MYKCKEFSQIGIQIIEIYLKIITLYCSNWKILVLASVKGDLMRSNLIFVILLGMTTLTSIYGCEFGSSFNTQAEIQPQKKQEIKVNGSGSAYKPLKLLAAAYEEKNPNIKIVFYPSSQTSGGVRSVKDGVISIGVSSRDLTAEESKGIEYRVFAKDALVVATHENVKGVANLSTEQLKAIYRGDINNWQKLGGPNNKIVVLDRAEDEASKILIRKHFLGKYLRVTSKAALMLKEKHVIETLLSTPDTIGYFSLVKATSENLPVNTLSLDGVEPTIDNIKNGKYKMTRNIGIVWKTQPSAATRQFIEFICSEEAAQKLETVGYVNNAK